MDFQQIDFNKSSGKVVMNGSLEAATLGRKKHNVCD